MIIYPEMRFTEQHKLWIGYCLSSFVEAVLDSCPAKDRGDYIRVMAKYFERRNYPEERYIMLLKVLDDMKRSDIPEEFMTQSAPL